MDDKKTKRFYYKDEAEVYLEHFICFVRDNKPVPRSLLEFMADGAEAYLKHEKPWPKKTGSKIWFNNNTKRKEMTKRYILKEIGCNDIQIERFIGGSAKKIYRDVKEVKAFFGGLTLQDLVDSWHQPTVSRSCDWYLLRWELEELIEIQHDVLTAARKKEFTRILGIVNTVIAGPEESTYGPDIPSKTPK